MSVLNIREAERAGARLVVALAGISGGGKTFTALQLAYGLANGNAKKVGLLDTENRRGSLYADSIKNKAGEVQRFLIGDLRAPFSPQRYIDAILEFQAAGVEVLVIDTASHEWNGLGGVLSIVNGYEKSITGWKNASPEHKRFMNTMLQCDMHIIACIRATNKTDWKDPKNPKALGIMPVQQEEFMFETTVSMMMWDGGKSRDVMKCPAELVPIFGKNGETSTGYLTAKHGLALRKWVDGGVQLDTGLEAARNTLHTITEQGVAAVRKAWDAQPEDMRKKLGAAFLQELLASAEGFDEQREAATSEGGAAQLEDLNSRVLGSGAAAAKGAQANDGKAAT
jgi:hypothetical protein